MGLPLPSPVPSATLSPRYGSFGEWSPAEEIVAPLVQLLSPRTTVSTLVTPHMESLLPWPPQQQQQQQQQQNPFALSFIRSPASALPSPTVQPIGSSTFVPDVPGTVDPIVAASSHPTTIAVPNRASAQSASSFAAMAPPLFAHPSVVLCQPMRWRGMPSEWRLDRLLSTAAPKEQSIEQSMPSAVISRQRPCKLCSSWSWGHSRTLRPVPASLPYPLLLLSRRCRCCTLVRNTFVTSRNSYSDCKALYPQVTPPPPHQPPLLPHVSVLTNGSDSTRKLVSGEPTQLGHMA